MFTWHPFYIICAACNHRNRPHRSPAKGVRMVLDGTLLRCKGCNAKLYIELPNHPLVQRVRAELHAERKPGWPQLAPWCPDLVRRFRVSTVEL